MRAEENNDHSQKAIRRILQERGKWRNRMPLKCEPSRKGTPHHERGVVYGFNSPFCTAQCCASHCLSQEPDILCATGMAAGSFGRREPLITLNTTVN